MDEKELKFVNSRFRQFFLKHHEFRIIKRLLRKNKVNLKHKVLLDVGCGSGYSTELLSTKFKPQELFAFDILPLQVALAKHRELSATLFTGDVTGLKLPGEKFDGVFAFTVLHHVPEWRKGLKELYRILKPGGVLIAEEPDRKALDHVERHFNISHPQESRFEWPEFAKALEETGFSLLKTKKIYFGHFMLFLCQKQPTV